MDTGRLGEDLAAQCLKKKGYKILSRNFRTKFGELDIVCQKGNAIVFVEVKTLAENEAGFEPELHFTFEKMRRMRKAAQIYLLQNSLSDKDFQLDLIALELADDGTVKDLRHYENLTL